MRFNNDALKWVSQKESDKEGKLCYKSPKEGYRNRYCKLRNNLLFIFKSNDSGDVLDYEPVAVFVLEKFVVQIEPPDESPFVFSIRFDYDVDRKHYFSGLSQNICTEWVRAFQCVNYQNLKAQFDKLRSVIIQRTGKDPCHMEIQRRLKEAKSNSHFLVPLSPNPPTNRVSTISNSSGSVFYDSEPKRPAPFEGWVTFD